MSENEEIIKNVPKESRKIIKDILRDDDSKDVSFISYVAELLFTPSFSVILLYCYMYPDFILYANYALAVKWTLTLFTIFGLNLMVKDLASMSERYRSILGIQKTYLRFNYCIKYKFINIWTDVFEISFIASLFVTNRKIQSLIFLICYFTIKHLKDELFNFIGKKLNLKED